MEVEDFNEHEDVHMSDHDILVTMRGSVRNIARDVRTLKDGVEGRLTKVESDVDSLKIWRAVTVGALSVLVTFLIPLLVYIWQTTRNVDDAVARGVSSALDQYTITTEVK